MKQWRIDCALLKFAIVGPTHLDSYLSAENNGQ